MSKVFGGSKSKSSSWNSNEGLINSKFGGAADFTATAGNALGRLLSGDASGFNAFKDATGFSQLLQEGSRGITGNAAARGLLRSGSTGQALMNYGNMMQNQYANSYMQNLLGQGQLGLGAGQLLASVGQKSKGTSSSKPGLGGFIGGIGSGIAASDRRLKENIKKVGKFGEINLYHYNYIHQPNVTRAGVMADEVAQKYPEALGPTMSGYATVDYGKLREVVGA